MNPTAKPISRPTSRPSAKAKPIVVVGIVGSVLDGGGDERTARKKQRFRRWRPSVDLVQHASMPVARFDLLHHPRHKGIAEVVRDDIIAVRPKTTVNLVEIAMRDAWDFEEVYGALYDYAKTAAFDPEKEDVLVHITTGTHVAQICWFLLAESRRLPARLLQTGPPKKTKGERDKDAPAPRGTVSIIDLDLSKYDALRRRLNVEKRDGASLLKRGIATKNAAYNALIDELEIVARDSTSTILLLGETGTGKTALARRIYDLKLARRQVSGAFVEVNCATLRGDHAMSTLFGHKKGAYTGAVTDRAGLLQTANGGVVFLDEVAELGLDEQAMLLRAIEEKRFLPLGADKEVTSSFQLLCGTHRDLSARVRAGLFREDLIARLDVWRFTLPPLRTRIEDIAPNVDVELDNASARRGHAVFFDKNARAAFLNFATGEDDASSFTRWPGNFRDLASSIERLSTLCAGGRIAVKDVERECTRLKDAWTRAVNERDLDGATADNGAHSVFSAARIDAVLVDVMGDEDARALDLYEKASLAVVFNVCRDSRSLADAGRTLFQQSRKKRTSKNDSDRLRKILAARGLTFDDVNARS